MISAAGNVAGAPVPQDRFIPKPIMLDHLLSDVPVTLEIGSVRLLASELVTHVRSEGYKVVCFGDLPPSPHSRTRLLVKRLHAALPDVRIAVGPRGSIARTSSGKPRRKLIWRMLLEDRLPEGLEWDLDLVQAVAAAAGAAGDSRVPLDSRSRASSTGNAASR